MMKLNPAVRTGLIWACVHQVWALCGLATLWLLPGLFFVCALSLLLIDLPSILLISYLAPASWRPMTSQMLGQHLPGNDPGLGYPVLIVLTLGALQWLLIGYVVGRRRERRAREREKWGSSL